jgi:hypothetical protein
VGSDLDSVRVATLPKSTLLTARISQNSILMTGCSLRIRHFVGSERLDGRV